jgi:hypothetical protein
VEDFVTAAHTFYEGRDLREAHRDLMHELPRVGLGSGVDLQIFLGPAFEFLQLL